jgi:formylglycine-generating enzyme
MTTNKFRVQKRAACVQTRVACVQMLIVMFLAYLILFVSACAYSAAFKDCAVSCVDDAGCPDGLSCGGEGLCRTAGAMAACSMIPGGDGNNDGGSDGSGGSSFPSCADLPATCGPNGNDDCCSIATPIPGGTYYRSYDLGSDNMFPDMSYPATVSAFVLDKYEVTVGRFRAFIAAGRGTRANPPAAGAGAHAQIANSGWDASWDAADLEVDAAALSAAIACDSQYETWTAAPGGNEDLPINCVTWYEAEAFCAWDGGYLPTEAEWNYAAAGGGAQQAYAWSSPAGSLSVDCSDANYDVDGGPTYCVPGVNGAVATMNRVGSESPKGDGAWGQSDLGGNAWEWTLDWYATYVNPCVDCASLTPSGNRVIRGGDFTHAELYMRTANRGLTTDSNSEPSSRTRDVGFRCARP